MGRGILPLLVHAQPSMAPAGCYFAWPRAAAQFCQLVQTPKNPLQPEWWQRVLSFDVASYCRMRTPAESRAKNTAPGTLRCPARPLLADDAQAAPAPPRRGPGCSQGCSVRSQARPSPSSRSGSSSCWSISRTGGGSGLATSFYGESVTPQSYVEREWTDSEIVDFINDRRCLTQVVIMLRKSLND